MKGSELAAPRPIFGGPQNYKPGAIVLPCGVQKFGAGEQFGC